MIKLFQEYYQNITQFSRNVKLYLIAFVLNSMGVGMFQVLYNLYLEELQYGEAFIGQTVSLKAWAAVLILLPAGILSDRIGRRKSMIIGAVSSSIIFVFLSVTENSQLILMMIFLNGLFNSFFMVAQSPFMMENTTSRERMHLFSINSILMMGAWTLGNFFGGLIPDTLNQWMPQLTAMKGTLFICALLVFLGGIPLYKIKEVRTIQRQGFKEIIGVLKEKRELMIILKFLLPGALVGFGAGLFVPYTNMYLSNEFGLSTTLIGTILGVSQIMTAFSTFIGPLLVKKLGRVKAVFFLQMASIPFLFIMGTTAIPILAIVAVLMRTALMNSGNPITANLMMETVGESVKGIANSLNQMVFQLGWAIMGPISGWLIADFGYSYIFYLAMLFYLGSALSYYIFFKDLERNSSVQIEKA